MPAGTERPKAIESMFVAERAAVSTAPLAQCTDCAMLSLWSRSEKFAILVLSWRVRVPCLLHIPWQAGDRDLTKAAARSAPDPGYEIGSSGTRAGWATMRFELYLMHAKSSILALVLGVNVEACDRVTVRAIEE